MCTAAAAAVAQLPISMALSVTNAVKNPPPGLQTLLVGDGHRGGVMTRTLVASRRAVGGGDVGHVGYLADAACVEEEDECWVSHGRRCLRRRLPPPIPSLLRAGDMRGYMARTRTDDGRLVIRDVPVARSEHMHARRRNGRLILQLVRCDDRQAPPPPLPRPWSAQENDVPMDDETSAARASVSDVQTAVQPPTLPLPVGLPLPRRRWSAQENDVHVDDETSAERASVSDVQTAVQPPAAGVARPALVRLEGCFEDVIGRSSLHQTPMSMLRMAHTENFCIRV